MSKKLLDATPSDATPQNSAAGAPPSQYVPKPTKVYLSEKDVKAEVKKILDSLPHCWWYMPVQAGYGEQGIPDFVGCIAGKFFAIETKYGKNTLSPWQDRQRAGIVASKGFHFVVHEKNIVTIAHAMQFISEAENVSSS